MDFQIRDYDGLVKTPLSEEQKVALDGIIKEMKEFLKKQTNPFLPSLQPLTKATAEPLKFRDPMPIGSGFLILKERKSPPNGLQLTFVSNMKIVDFGEDGK